jgi:cyclophilin family peptidyl-prolyl cis-trans isomerase
VARILELVRKNFYNGLRFHRAEPKFLVQIGDPVSRDVSRQAWWGQAGSGKPLMAAEITKKRRHVRGAVGMAYAGTDAKLADSQFYIVLRDAPSLDGRYAVFGRVIKGMEIVEKIERGDVLMKAAVRE